MQAGRLHACATVRPATRRPAQPAWLAVPRCRQVPSDRPGTVGREALERRTAVARVAARGVVGGGWRLGRLGPRRGRAGGGPVRLGPG